MLPVICFVGRSGVGKTTVIEKVVEELKSRNYRVAAVKHAGHGIDMDREGKDSWRFLKAGADAVVVSSENEICLMRRTAALRLEQIIASLEGEVDLVLVEGYKHSYWPRIEVVRSLVSPEALQCPEHILAIVSDRRFPLSVPQFGFDDIKGIASLVEQIAATTTSSRSSATTH